MKICKISDYDLDRSYTIDVPKISATDNQFGKKFMQEIKDRNGGSLSESKRLINNKDSAISFSQSAAVIDRLRQTQPRFGYHDNLRVVFKNLPHIQGDVEDDMDDCDYQIENRISGLKRDTKILSRMESAKYTDQNNLANQDIEKVKQARKKMFRKSRSVMLPKSVLKKADTIKGSKKQVQFSTKKTVYWYNPHN